MCICKFAVFFIFNTASLNPAAAPECPVVYAGNNIQRKWLVQYQPYIYYTNSDENTNGIQKQITKKRACLKVYLPQQYECKDNACVTCVKWTIEVAYKQYLLMTLDLDILSIKVLTTVYTLCIVVILIFVTNYAFLKRFQKVWSAQNKELPFYQLYTFKVKTSYNLPIIWVYGWF